MEGFYYLGSEVFGIRFHKTMMPHGPTLLRIAVGLMLYDFDYANTRPVLFNAKLEDGILRVPHRTEVAA